MRRFALVAVLLTAMFQTQASENSTVKEKPTYVCLSVEQLNALGVKLDVNKIEKQDSDRVEATPVVEGVDQLKQENAIFIFPQINIENTSEITSVESTTQEYVPFDYEQWELHQQF